MNSFLITHRYTSIYIFSFKYRHAYTGAHAHTHRHRNKHKHRQTDAETEIETETETDRDRDRDTDTDRERERYRNTRSGDRSPFTGGGNRTHVAVLQDLLTTTALYHSAIDVLIEFDKYFGSRVV